MYIVKDSDGHTIAICSSYKDAQAFQFGATVDNLNYTIEEVKHESKTDQSFDGNEGAV